MVVARVVVVLTLASSAATGRDPDLRLRAQDTSRHERPLILAHVVSGSDGGLADGMYVIYESTSAAADEQGGQSLKWLPLVCLVGMCMKVDLVHVAGLIVPPILCQILVHGLGGAIRGYL